MRERVNILDVSSAHPDFMGFIFYKNSPRYVGADFSIPDDLDVNIQRIGVFVNEEVGAILDLVLKHRLDFVQLHGDESPAQCKELMEKGIGVIKVFSVDDDFDFTVVDQYQSEVDYFLFDTKGKARGGNGVAFNWSLLENYKGAIPYFLSGGIDPENVNEVIGLKHEQLFAIDVNSGIERAPGSKDVSKLNLLIKNYVGR
ncbi:MAG: phosphoribosylanthranilate isomerase [Cyclobacteriaceae bacterium]